MAGSHFIDRTKNHEIGRKDNEEELMAVTVFEKYRSTQ